MKKKLLAIITVCFIFCTAIFTLCACGGAPSLKSVTFEVDGAVYHKVILEDDEIPAFPPNPTKSGYEFIGWFDSDEQVTEFTEPLTTSKKLVAKWNAIEYLATFVIDGNTVGTATFTMDDTKIENTPEIPVRNGYEGKWDYTIQPQNITVTLSYSLVEYKITYKNADGITNPNPTTYTIESDTITLSALDNSNGFPFIGWYDSNGKVTEIVKGSFGDITLTAKFDVCSLGLDIVPSQDNTYAIVSGLGSCTDRHIIIPSVYNNLPVKKIAEEAFYDCENIVAVTIPSTIDEIGDDAFYGCSRLLEVYNLSDINIIAGDYQNGYIANYAIDVYTDAETMSKLTITDDGYAFYQTETDTYLCWYEGTGKNITLPSTFNEKTYVIRDSAFAHNDVIETVVIPEGVTTIEGNAFYYCASLKKVTLPQSLTTVGSSLFSPLALKELHFNGTINDWLNIDFDDSIFTYGVKFYIDNEFVTNVVIPDSVTTLKQYSFYNYQYLLTLTFGANVNDIDYNTFGGSVYPYEVYNLTGQELSSLNFSLDNYALATHTSLSEESKIVIVDNDFAFFNGEEKMLLKYLGDQTNVTLPQQFKGGSYKIYDYAFSRTKIENITFGNVTEIGQDTFSYTNLSSVVFPDSVTFIDSNAFYNCAKLNSVQIGKNVAKIESGAFNYCTKLINVCNLSSLSVVAGDQSNGMVAYYAYAVTTSTSEESPYVKVGDFTFYNDGDTYSLIAYTGNSTNLTLPEGVNGNSYKIAKSVFASSNVESVVIPNKVTEIQKSAFLNCYNLKSVTLGNDVETIGEYAFSGCNALTEVIGGKNVATILKDAFYGCQTLTNVGFGENLVTIGDYAFSYSKVSNFIFGNKLQTIGSRAFYGVPFTDVVLPESLLSIDKLAITICKNLTIKSNSLSYSNEAFTYCELVSLTCSADLMGVIPTLQYIEEGTLTLTITSGAIGNSAFKSNLLIKEVNILKDVTIIGSSAFSHCSNLAVINIEEGVSEIGSYAFAYTPITEITLPKNITSFGGYTFYYCTALTTATLPENASLSAYMFKYCTALSTVNLPDSLTTIATQAFYGCVSLTSFTVGPNVTTIASSAFEDSGLVTVVVGDKVKTIGEKAFASCKNLKSVTLGSSVTTIGEYAFSYCSSLNSITIPKSVSTIEAYAFYWSGITAAYFEHLIWWTYPLTGSGTKLTLQAHLSYATYLKTTYVACEWKKTNF